MKILIVGGTGLTGAHAALYLRARGHEVTISSRSEPVSGTEMSTFAHIPGNYLDNSISDQTLQAFEGLVFCAAQDLRHLTPDINPAAYFHDMNSVAVPAFMQRAKQAGIRRCVLVGSYYPHIVPELIETDGYVRSRYLSQRDTVALNDERFNVCTLDAPFILGYAPGAPIPHLEALVAFGLGALDGIPLIAPDGGMNFIASQSMSEAIEGALLHGIGGKNYLIGDENLSWKTYLELFCSAVGKPRDLDVSRDEHPLFPDLILYAGRNAVVHYEPEVGELGYSRNNVAAAVAEISSVTLKKMGVNDAD